MLVPVQPASAAISQGITGTVTGPGGVPLEFGGVSAYAEHPEWGWEYSGYASVSSDGTYELSLPPGAYHLQFSPGFDGLATEWWGGVATRGASTPVTVTADAVTSGISPELEAGGHIAGTLLPVVAEYVSSYVAVYAADPTEEGGFAFVTSVGVNPETGAYDVPSLLSGQYKVRFSVSSHESEYYNNKATLAAADDVTVAAPETTSNINATLAPLGRITGTVTGPGGVAVADAMVRLLVLVDGGGWEPLSWYDDEGYGETRTDEDGTYSLPAPAGTYRVEFVSGGDDGFLGEFFDDVTAVADAQDVTIQTDTVTPNINAQLREGGHIQGHVAQAVGVGGSVRAYQESPQEPGRWVPVTSTAIDEGTGNYDVNGLDGDYRLRFSVDGFVKEFWENAEDLATATTISADAPETVTGIDPTLTALGHIRGTLTAPLGHPESVYSWVTVDAFRATQVEGETIWVHQTSQEIALDGPTAYDLAVPPGSYRLRFSGTVVDDTEGVEMRLATEYYNDKRTIDQAESIAVAEGEDVTGKDATLDWGAELGGTLSFPVDAGARSKDRAVTIYDTTTGTLVTSALARWETDTEATWSVQDLMAGTYRVEFARVSGPALGEAAYSAAYDRVSGPAMTEAEYFDDNPESAGVGAADPVTVGVDGSNTSVDALMRVGGQITGTLVDGEGIGLAGCRVQATSDTEGQLVTRSNITGATGTFAVTGLSTGNYHLTILDRGDCDHAEFYTEPDGDLSLENTGPETVAVQVGETTALPTALYYGTDLEAPPVANTVAPSVPAEAPVVGTEVTATPGTWNPADATLAYQWFAGDTPISGATTVGYTPTVDDIGETLKVRVTASKAGFTSTAVTSNSTAAVVAPAGEILNTTAPSVPAEAPVVGTAVTANPGAWTPTGVSFAYQWRANNADIPGATQASYTPVNGDYGKALSVRVTGSKSGLDPVSVVSNATAAVTAQVLNSIPPAVSGIARVGLELTAYDGFWFPFTPTLSRQWLRDGVPVAGATGTTYPLTDADAGSRISLRVTATHAGYLPRTVTSDPTVSVSLGAITLTDVPKLLGKLKVGKILKAVAPSSTPAATTVKYQWLRNGKAIKGAAARKVKYQLVKADKGRKISVRITVLRPGYADNVSVAKRSGRVG